MGQGQGQAQGQVQGLGRIPLIHGIQNWGTPSAPGDQKWGTRSVIPTGSGDQNRSTPSAQVVLDLGTLVGASWGRLGSLLGPSWDRPAAVLAPFLAVLDAPCGFFMAS